jgi:hypothetical protein
MIVRVGESNVDVRVEAVLSVPRLGFQDAFFTWAQALMPLNIRPTKATGVYWSQCMTRVFEQFIDKCEYLITIDYDSFFSREDLEHLMALAMTYQCDALTGLQTKRDDGRPMFTMLGQLDNPPANGETTVSMNWLREPVQEVDTAHFGLTVISTAALRRAKRPWFVETPAPDGGWGPGRRDADIGFWANWRASGNRVYISPRVTIGHGEFMVAWPGKDLGSAVYQGATEYCNTMKRPETAWSLPQS